MTVPKMMNTANCHITADGGDTGRLPQKIEKNFLIGLRGTHPALPVLSADAVRAGAPVRRCAGAPGRRTTGAARSAGGRQNGRAVRYLSREVHRQRVQNVADDRITGILQRIEKRAADAFAASAARFFAEFVPLRKPAVCGRERSGRPADRHQVLTA